MQSESTGLDVLFFATFLDQSMGQLRTFAISDHPAGNVAAEHVQDHVEIKIVPFCWSEQLADVPAPELIGSVGHQFRLLVGRMNQLIATFAVLATLLHSALHRSAS